MADPVWSAQYNFGSTPEQNGFTRFLYHPNPVITPVTSGPGANRRLEVDTSAGGGVSFLTTSVPAFNAALGMTAEITVNVTGPGDAGFEVTFLEFPIGLNIYTDRATLERIGTTPLEAATASNSADIAWRITFDTTNLRVYRAGALVFGPLAPVMYPKPSQQFQFWVEGGSAAIYRGMKYYIAGAVAP